MNLKRKYIIIRRNKALSTNKSFNYPDNELYQFVQEELHKRGITAYSIGEIAYEMQHDYLPDYEISDFAEQFSEVLKKREVLNLLAFAFELDNLANKRMFSEPIQSIIENDAGFWQIDEILASSLAQLFGMLAITNYGYLDKNKVGIARRLDEEDSITVFSDDIVSALASAVIGRCGHGSKLELEDNITEEDKYPKYKYVDMDETKLVPGKEENKSISHHDWDLNKFGYDLQEALLESRKIEDAVEEAFDHDFYVDMSVISPDDNSSWLLRVDFSDNKLNLIYVSVISLEKLLTYIWRKTGVNGELIVDLSGIIADYLRENDLIPNQTDFNNKESDNSNHNLSYNKYNNDKVSDSTKDIVDILTNLLNDRKDDLNE